MTLLKKFSSKNVLFFIFQRQFLQLCSKYICFRANHSQDWVFKISKVIQNFDYKYISGHVLPCTQNCHLNSNSTHCAPPPPFVGIRRQQNKSLAYDASHMHLLTNHFSRRLQLKRHLICGGFSYLYILQNKKLYLKPKKTRWRLNYLYTRSNIPYIGGIFFSRYHVCFFDPSSKYSSWTFEPISKISREYYTYYFLCFDLMI